MLSNELFQIDLLVQEKFPEIHVGMAVIRNITVSRKNKSLDSLKKTVISEVKEMIGDTSITELPRVKAFREIYKRFGIDPSSKRSSVEALLRRVIDPKKGLYKINTVVDAYNLSSVQYQLPMAAYDLDKIEFPLTLRIAGPGEQHVSIGKETTDTVKEGSLVYADQVNILCRDFNYRDSDVTKVTDDTHNLAVFVDGCSEVTRGELKEAIRSVVDRIIVFNGGSLEDILLAPGGMHITE